MDCSYTAGAWYYLEPDGDWMDGTSFTPTQLQLAAQLLDLDPELPPEVLCQQITELAPSKAWCIANMTAASHLDDETKIQIRYYVSYGYDRINSSLRHPYFDPNLLRMNQAIETLPPLEKDIVVLRRINRKIGLPESGPFVSLGYLSTSVAYSSYLSRPEIAQQGSILRIRVPAGTHALFVPGNEEELIFKHGITLDVLAHYKKPVVVKGKEYLLDWYDLQML